MAGGYDYLTGGWANRFKYHRIVERSTNNGSSFQVLPDFPYGNAGGMFEACLVIIDDNTVFLGGGRYSKFSSENFAITHHDDMCGQQISCRLILIFSE